MEENLRFTISSPPQSPNESAVSKRSTRRIQTPVGHDATTFQKAILIPVDRAPPARRRLPDLARDGRVAGTVRRSANAGLGRCLASDFCPTPPVFHGRRAGGGAGGGDLDGVPVAGSVGASLGADTARAGDPLFPRRRRLDP